MPVGWVVRIGLTAVIIDQRGIAARLVALLFRVMAAGAKALQRAETEQIPVAAMRLDMIDMSSAGHRAIARAEFAERMRQQLLLPAPLPEGRAVEMRPCLTHGRRP